MREIMCQDKVEMSAFVQNRNVLLREIHEVVNSLLTGSGSLGCSSLVKMDTRIGRWTTAEPQR